MHRILTFSLTLIEKGYAKLLGNNSLLKSLFNVIVNVVAFLILVMLQRR
jgi:hypothetical protein